MVPKCVKAVYFSPTGGTRKAALALAEELAGRFAVPCESIDFTLPAAREQRYVFAGSDLVVFACPTYAGKLPNKILPFVKSGFEGNGAVAAAVVTFGNRSFDNSLAELVKCLTDSGFLCTAGAGIVTRHCFSKVLAADRPDGKDREAMLRFAADISGKLQKDDVSPVSSIPGDADAPYYRPKGLDGEPVNILKVKPKTDMDRCDKCMLCVKLCPMGSIDPEDPSLTTGICIKCQACIRLCPKEAKYIDDPQFLSHKAMLEKSFLDRKEPEWYV